MPQNAGVCHNWHFGSFCCKRACPTPYFIYFFTLLNECKLKVIYDIHFIIIRRSWIFNWWRKLWNICSSSNITHMLKVFHRINVTPLEENKNFLGLGTFQEMKALKWGTSGCLLILRISNNIFQYLKKSVFIGRGWLLCASFLLPSLKRSYLSQKID